MNTTQSAKEQNAKAASAPRLEPSWKKRLEEQFNVPTMIQLREFLRQEYARGKKIYPRGDQYFEAFRLTPFEQVKVVILGQDPYHGPGQAHGLSFSVPPGVPAPPSLVNIFKELESDLGIKRASHGNLEAWAQQGVLLLNSVLTVEAGMAASHQKQGWEFFTDAVIKVLAEQREHLVFVLWGTYAQKKAAFVDRKRHCVLESVHPSPLSSHRGFFGSKPFSKANGYLIKTGQTPINWDLSKGQH